MAQKVLLLDIDGVLLKDRLLLQNVSENAVRFVQKTVPMKYLDSTQARHLNKTLYKSHGHTLAGLRIAFPNYAEYYTNFNFNSKVYDSSLLNHLFKYTKTSEEFKSFQTDFQMIQEKCRDVKVPIYLFTNSPLEWALPIANALDIESAYVFHSNHVDCEDYLLKANPYIYKKVYNNLKERYSHSPIECIFVDDSPINLLPVLSSIHWTPIHYDESHSVPLSRMNYINTISSIPEFKIYLN
jgi:FMN phosphatase YigB (HAD superfamily)